MTSFIINLKEEHLYQDGQKCYQMLPEDQRADLSRRFGKNLLKLGSLDILQIADVLDRLLDFASTPIPNTHRINLMVTLKSSCPASTQRGPLVLDDEELGELCLRIGEDLEVIRSLGNLQLEESVLSRACRAGYLLGSKTWPDEKIENSTFRLYDNQILPPENVEGSSSRASEPPVTTNLAVWPHEGFDREPAQPNISASPHGSGNIPEVIGSGTEMGSLSTLPMVSAASPTLIRDYPDTTNSSKKRRGSNSPRVPGYKRANRRAKLSRNTQKQGEKVRLVEESNLTAWSLLEGCNFNGIYLKNKKIKVVVQACAYLLPPDPAQMLRFLSDQWHTNVSQGQHALGLPKEWIGIHAALNYMKILESGTLDSVAKVVAYMLFYINFEILCRNPERYCTRPPKRGNRNETYVLDCIEEVYLDGSTLCSESQTIRDDISNKYRRKGKWCWEVVAALGAGVLLFGGKWLDKIYNNSFSSAQVDAFVTYVSYTRSGSVRLFHLLEPTMKTLISGQIPDLIRTFQYGATNLKEQLYAAAAEDQRAMGSQSNDCTWNPIVGTVKSAEERIRDFHTVPCLDSFRAEEIF